MRALLALLACLAATSPALAHPHVWITAKAELVYGPDGKVAALRHHWTFDEAYSAFAVQGLDANGDGKLSREELQPFATTSMESLTEFGYFTTVKAAGLKQKLGPPRADWMSYEGNRLTLHFEMPLDKAAPPKLVVMEVADPTFFVDFTPSEGADAVVLAGAPVGCTVNVTRPKPAQPIDTSKLSEAFFQSLGASSSFGSQFGTRALAACP